MSLGQTLVDGGTVSWRRSGDVVEAAVDGDHAGSVQPGTASLDGEQFTLSRHRAHDSIDDAGTGAVRVIVRRRAHGPISVETGGNRYRITREGLRFFTRLVTLEAGGATVLRALRVGGTIRVMATEDADGIPARDLAFLSLALVQTWFGLDETVTDADAEHAPA